MDQVPPVQVDVSQLDRFFQQNSLAIAIVAGLLVALYLLAPRIVPRTVRRTLQSSVGDFEQGGVTAVELEKRATTIERLVLALLRAAALSGLCVIIVGFLGVWGLLGGAVLFLAAVTLAGQSIVLDFLMGIFIVVEGTYFHGDNISAGDPAWGVAGTVETVGLRRTVIRSPDGTVHSISNSFMRQVSNRTRVFAAAEVHIPGIREEDLDRALVVMDQVGQDLAMDGQFSESIIEAPAVKFVGDPDDLGWSAKMRGKVVAGERWVVATELLKRLNRAFLEEGIELNKRGVAPRVARSGGNAAPPYVPEAE